MRGTLALCALVLVGGLAYAAPKGKNLQDTEQWRESEDLLKRNEKSASEACGVKLSIAYDVSSFGTLALAEAKPVDVYCRDAFNALWGSVCRSPEGKAAVQSKVSAVSCRHSTDGTRVTLDGKTLIIHVDPKKKDLAGAIPGGTHWATAIKQLL